MNEEEYFRKNYPDSCYGDKPLSPHWDFFQDGVEFGERQSEEKIQELEAQLAISEHDREHNDYELTEVYKKIEVLEKENAELKELLEACKQERIEALYRNEQYIKENAELKAENEANENGAKKYAEFYFETNDKLTKAKEHIKKLLDCLKQDTNDPQTNYYVCQYMDKAEQFIKDSKKEC